MTLGTAKIIEYDMEPWQLQECIDCTMYALHNFKDEETVSEFIKKEFDLKYEPSWHVVVGQSFGALVGHEIRKCAYFSVGCLYFLIFKSPDPEVAYLDGDAKDEEEEEEEGGEGEHPQQEEQQQQEETQQETQEQQTE